MRMIYGQFLLEMRLFWREKASFFWSFLFPIFLILLFGTIFGGDGDKSPIRFRVGIADHDQSEASRTLIDSGFARVPIFRITEGALDSLLAQLREGQGVLVVEIPKGFSSRLDSGGAELPVYYNASKVQFNAAALAVLDNIEYGAARHFTDLTPPVAFAPRAVDPTETTDINYVSYLLAGIIGMSVMSTGLFGIGFVLVTYRAKGNLKRLQVTPLPKSAYILGLIGSRFVTILLQAVVVVVIAIWVFDFTIQGPLLDTFAFLSIGIVTFIALGFLIGARLRSSEAGAGITNIIFFPMMFLSGTFFPVDGLPGFLQPLLLIFPLRYLNDGLRTIIAEGHSFAAAGLDAAILAGFALVFLLVTVKLFRWQ